VSTASDSTYTVAPKWHHSKQDDICNNTFHRLINRQQGTTCLLSQLLSKVTVTSCRSSAGILHGCLQQDGAPSHTTRNTLCPSTVGHQRRRFTRINQLKQAIITEWGQLLQRFIDCDIGQWRRRLEWVVPQQDEQIEHLMQKLQHVSYFRQ